MEYRSGYLKFFPPSEDMFCGGMNKFCEGMNKFSEGMDMLCPSASL